MVVGGERTRARSIVRTAHSVACIASQSNVCARVLSWPFWLATLLFSPVRLGVAWSRDITLGRGQDLKRLDLTVESNVAR